MKDETAVKNAASTGDEIEAAEDAQDLADLRAAIIQEEDLPTKSLEEVKRELGS